jgi:Ca-activated chloride channel family protein
VFPASVPASQENLAFAKWLIEGQNGGGGTELVPALQQALATPKATGSSRTFLLITDGYVGVEASAFRLIRSRLGEANLFVFGIGSSVNRHLMESLARAGQGEPFIVTDPERAPEIASQFRKYVSTPVLTKVAVTFDGLETYDVEPISPPDLLAERPLVIFGKWRGALQGKVRVDGLTGKSAYSWQQDISTATRLPDAEGLARLWARSRIAQLSDQYDLTSTDDLKQAITQLGLRYNLLTKYTSFVAVDEVVRRKVPDLETIKQPLPMPAGVEDSAVGDPDVGAAPEPSTYALAAVGASVLALAYVARRRRANKAALRAMP